MNDSNYSQAFNVFRNFSSGFLGYSVNGKCNKLAEAFRRCYKECRAVEDSRGLRILAIGPARGHLIEDALFTAWSDIRIDRLDCVEPNTHMLIELKERMGLLASKFDFSYTIHNRHFNSEESRSFLPNNFYDLLVFSHVLYYFDDPGFVLETALHELAHSNGRAYTSLHVNSKSTELMRDEFKHIIPSQTTDESPPNRNKKELSILDILAGTKTRIVSKETVIYGVILHLALEPGGVCISEFDKQIHHMADGLLSYETQMDIEDIGKLPGETRNKIQNIIRKYSVDCYGFPIIPEPTEIALIARE